MTDLMTDSQVTAPTGQTSGTRGRVKLPWVVIATLVGAVAFQFALMASYTGAYAAPVLHHVTIGLVGPSPAAAGEVSYQPLPGAAAARQEVSDGTLPAALIVEGSHQTLVVAGAAGLTLTDAVEQVVTVQAAAAHATLAVEDVRPLPAGDPRGFASYLLVLGWIIGGYLGMILLTRALGPRARGRRGTARLTAWAAVYAVASGALGVVLMDPLMGRLTGHPWALLGAGTLIVFAVAMSTASLISLFKTAGIVPAIVAFVVLGNPTSGGAVPVQLLSSGYRVLAKILPNNAGIALVHGIEYFGGNQLGHPLLVLALYAVIATAVCFAQALRRSRRARPAPARQPATA
jgi:hypothetical protein